MKFVRCPRYAREGKVKPPMPCKSCRRFTVVEPAHERVHLVDFEIEPRVAVIVDVGSDKRLVHRHRLQRDRIKHRRIHD